jgi:short-subunit dehydrogenase
MKPEQMKVMLTGACGGIGNLLARKLASQGASLYLTGRDADALLKLEQELNEKSVPGQVICATAIDLMDEDQIDQWIDALKAQGHSVNVLVNNAGVSRFDLFENLSERDIEQIMVLNSIVPMKLTRKLLPMLRGQGEARIVNIASTFGAIGFPGYSVYSASKYAIRGFSEALSRELADSQVQVGCFLPRATKTAINSDRVVELNQKLNVAMDAPEKVASELLSFLCSNKKEHAMGWPEKLLVPINSLFPSLVSIFIHKKLPLIKQYAA